MISVCACVLSGRYLNLLASDSDDLATQSCIRHNSCLFVFSCPAPPTPPAICVFSASGAWNSQKECQSELSWVTGNIPRSKEKFKVYVSGSLFGPIKLHVYTACGGMCSSFSELSLLPHSQGLTERRHLLLATSRHLFHILEMPSCLSLAP